MKVPPSRKYSWSLRFRCISITSRTATPWYGGISLKVRARFLAISCCRSCRGSGEVQRWYWGIRWLLAANRCWSQSHEHMYRLIEEKLMRCLSWGLIDMIIRSRSSLELGRLHRSRHSLGGSYAISRREIETSHINSPLILYLGSYLRPSYY